MNSPIRRTFALPRTYTRRAISYDSELFRLGGVIVGRVEQILTPTTTIENECLLLSVKKQRLWATNGWLKQLGQIGGQPSQVDREVGD